MLLDIIKDLFFILDMAGIYINKNIYWGFFCAFSHLIITIMIHKSLSSK